MSAAITPDPSLLSFSQGLPSTAGHPGSDIFVEYIGSLWLVCIVMAGCRDIRPSNRLVGHRRHDDSAS